MWLLEEEREQCVKAGQGTWQMEDNAEGGLGWVEHPQQEHPRPPRACCEGQCWRQPCCVPTPGIPRACHGLPAFQQQHEPGQLSLFPSAHLAPIAGRRKGPTHPGCGDKGTGVRQHRAALAPPRCLVMERGSPSTQPARGALPRMFCSHRPSLGLGPVTCSRQEEIWDLTAFCSLGAAPRHPSAPQPAAVACVFQSFPTFPLTRP